MNESDVLVYEITRDPLGEDEKRLIVDLVLAIGESFLPESDDPAVTERKDHFAVARTELGQLPGEATINEALLTRSLIASLLLMTSGLHQVAALARDSLDLAEEASEEYERIVNARTRARVARSSQRRDEITRMREAGEKVDEIAAKLDISTRRVIQLTPDHLKRRN